MATPENKARALEMDTVRAAQRSILLEPFNQRERNYLHRLFPSDVKKAYTTDLKPQGVDEKSSPIIYLDDLVKLVSPFEYERKTGDGFKLLFGLATTAETSDEVVNILRGTATLYSARQPYDISNRTYASFRAFLDHQHSIPEIKPSDKARFLIGEIVGYCDNSDLKVDDSIQEVGRIYFDKGNDPEVYAKQRAYLGEVLMFLLASGSYSQEWVRRLLEGSLKFDFGGTFQGAGILNPSIFDRDTSFWDMVSGSWVGMDDFKVKIPENPKDEPSSGAEKPKTANQALDDLRREFQFAKIDWYTKNARLNLEITHLNVMLSGLHKANSQLTKERDKLRQRAEAAERALFIERQRQWGQSDKTTGAPPKQTGDTVTDFLAGVGLTKDQVARMDPTKRKDLVRKLKRLAGYSFHPNNGVSPNEATLTLINEFLNQHDPGVNSTRR